MNITRYITLLSKYNKKLPHSITYPISLRFINKENGDIKDREIKQEDDFSLIQAMCYMEMENNPHLSAFELVDANGNKLPLFFDNKHPFRPNSYKTLHQINQKGYTITGENHLVHCIAVNKNEEPVCYTNRSALIVYPYYSTAKNKVRPFTTKELQNYISEKEQKKEQRKEERAAKGKQKLSKEKNSSIAIEDTIFQEIIQRELKNTPECFKDKHKLICFDTETTGLSAKTEELLQISIYDENEKELLNTFVRPYTHVSWEEAEKVNHISPNDVKNAPFPHEIAPLVRDIIKNTDILIGQNPMFDIRFLNACLGLEKFTKDKTVLDTRTMFKDLYPNHPAHLIDIVEEILPEQVKEFEQGAHRSDMDTIMTLRVYKKLCELSKEKEEMER